MVASGVFVACLLATGVGDKGKAPHIVHIVADDIGWNDLGFTNAAMRTPQIDALAHDGVKLTHFYAYKECAPSRSSIMTGRLAFKYGYYANPSDDGGVPTNYTMVPRVLQQQGYRTHALGKWHCGFRTPAHTPTQRGFESFLGFWHWGEEYIDHVFPPYYKNAKCRGIDFSNLTADGQSEVVAGLNGTQSANVYIREFDRIVAAHPDDAPLYVYFAFQNAHDPYEHAPLEFVSRQDESLFEQRRNFSAIVEELDWGVGRVVEALKRANMWQDTVILFTSDNGGELPFADQSRCSADCLTTACCGGAGSNYPLRGGKFTLFEGGVRAHAFVAGGSALLPRSRRGTSWPGMAHVSDIFSTLASLAGTMNPAPTDGHDLWGAIVNDEPSPRLELVHQPINRYWAADCDGAADMGSFQASCGASITVWPYKLLVGFPGDDRVVALPAPREIPASEPTTSLDLCVARPCLFDVDQDPSESRDLAAEQPEIVQALRARLDELSEPEAAPQPADALTPEPSDAACAVVAGTGAWQPWDDLLFVL